MTNTYQFPAMKNIRDFTIQDQLKKIEDEVKEAITACGDYGCTQLATRYDSPESEKAREHYLIELLDITHCVETALRMEYVDEAEYERIKQLVIDKNRNRGYYDD